MSGSQLRVQTNHDGQDPMTGVERQTEVPRLEICFENKWIEMDATNIISLPKLSGDRYYRPSVNYQLRQKGLDLADCGGDIHCALSKFDTTANNVEENLIPKNSVAFLVWNGYEKGDINFEKYITQVITPLLEWCSSRKANIKIYFVDRETGQLKDAIFPNLYQTTIGESDGRGLFQHGNLFEVVMPLAPSAASNNDNIPTSEFINLWKKFREDRTNKQQKCAICLKEKKLSNSHIIPDSILRMADTSFYSQNKVHSPSTVTEKLLCASSKDTYEQGCEQMLSSVEKELCQFLAGCDWKKTKPEDVAGGLIFDFQEAVKKKDAVKFTITMKVWHALISIAYRVLITWTGEPTENSLGEKITRKQINRMEESLGELAKALRRLTIYPYDEPTVCMWLLLSPSGTRARAEHEDCSPELYVRQVVLHGNDEVFMFIHFGIRGLHFVVTDVNDNFLEQLTNNEKQQVIALKPDRNFVIPYSHFEQRNGFLEGLMKVYGRIVKENTLASSIKIKNNTSESPEIKGNVERLPTGFNYNNGKLQLGRGWEECSKKDVKEDRLYICQGSMICEKMWILKSPPPNKKLNAVFAFTGKCKHVVFGYLLSNEGKIEGPMVGTTHIETYVKLIIIDRKEDIEVVIKKHWECIK